MNVVRDNTKKMSQLIDDILAFSRMGRLGMSVSEVKMEELAHAVFEELKPSLAGRELTMEIKPLPLCHGDLSMLRQVWVNLLANAIKFTRHKEAARVEVGRTHRGCGKSFTTSRTTARASTCSMPRNCSACSSVCMGSRNSRGRGLAWPS